MEWQQDTYSDPEKTRSGADDSITRTSTPSGEYLRGDGIKDTVHDLQNNTIEIL